VEKIAVVLVEAENDFAQAMIEVLAFAGIAAIAITLRAAVAGDINLRNLVEQLETRVVLWDVPYPYKNSVAAMHTLAAALPSCSVVPWSADAPAARKHMLPDDAKALVSKLDDIDSLIAMVRVAIASATSAPPSCDGPAPS
jgi:DNA-binding NarL/FixJ family response regulator